MCVPKTLPFTTTFSTKKSKKHLLMAVKTPAKIVLSPHFFLKNHPKT